MSGIGTYKKKVFGAGGGGGGTPTGTPYRFAGYNSLGNLSTFANYSIDPTTKGLFTAFNVAPNNQVGGYQLNNEAINAVPAQNSPDESWNFRQIYVAIDPDSTGFDMGTNGTFGAIFNLGFNHQGTSSIGNTQYFSTNSTFGNGTDPFNLKGFQYFLGFGSINNGVTITDSFQGFGLQMNVAAGATMDGYFNGFYDNMQFYCPVGSYISFSANPYIAQVKTNFQVTGFNVNPTIDEFVGTAGFTGIAVAGNFGSVGFGTGGVNGINVNPTISNFGAGNYYNGIFSSTNNITGPGTNKWAGYFEGDVNITGSLTFGGALSIGKLNAFHTQNVVDGGGNPSSVHMLVSNMVAPASSTIANADTLGVNTAALIQINNGATITSGPLSIGLAGLALPAVVETHTGSTIDYIGGAAFALNFSGTSTGGTLDQGYGGMFVPIPNGITTVNRWYGVWSRSPFGTIATDNWGIYAEDTEKNYFEGAVKIGGTDTPDGCALLEIESTTKGFLNARMTTTERNAITAVDGLQIYNTTTNKLQVYAGGSWVDLH